MCVPAPVPALASPPYQVSEPEPGLLAAEHIWGLGRLERSQR